MRHFPLVMTGRSKEAFASNTIKCNFKGRWTQTYKGARLIECGDASRSTYYDVNGVKFFEFTFKRPTHNIIGFNDSVFAEGFVGSYSANYWCILRDMQMNKIGQWGGSNYVRNAFIKPIETWNYASDLYLGDYLLSYVKRDWSREVRMSIYSSSLMRSLEITTDWGSRYSLPNGNLVGFSDEIFEIVLDEEIFN